MDKLKVLLGSNKFRGLLVTVIGLAIVKFFKVEVAPTTIMEFVVPISAWLIGQGISDAGKGAAQVEAIVNTISPASGMSPDQKSITLDAIKSV
jgi:hypothetical protein